MSSQLHHHPALVVAAYNRPHSLRRVLSALNNAQYPHDSIPLIISIDNSGSDTVKNEAEQFDWPHGPKIIRLHPERLGLKKHILTCGDLTQEYGSIALFEDDIYPSPSFYHFASEAIKKYEHDERIAGISLYGTRINEAAFMQFTPINDGSDTFFLKVPSSWGQIWTKKQWQEFRAWLSENDLTDISPYVTPNVRLWPETSWKKYACAYINQTGKFFVYPYLSLTTNFSDLGENHQTNSTRFQVPMQFFPKTYSFNSLDQSMCVYDEYCELLPDRLIALAPSLKYSSKEVCVDLYGVKDLNSFPDANYIITSRPVNSPIASWAQALKPHEMNIVSSISGEGLQMCHISHCQQEPRKHTLKQVCYHYNVAKRVITWCRHEIEEN
jgi:hypothetical protein